MGDIKQQGKPKVKSNNPTKIGGKSKAVVDDGVRGGAFQIMEAGKPSVSFVLKRRSKSTPKGIDPAYPNRNFVKMSFDNKGDKDGFFEYMYGDMGYPGNDSTKVGKKASNFGHSIGQRAGKLRLSGNKSAHRIGKR